MVRWRGKACVRAQRVRNMSAAYVRGGALCECAHDAGAELVWVYAAVAWVKGTP